MRIAISKGTGTVEERYGAWLKRCDPRIEPVDLSLLGDEDARAALAQASGIVFTGGEDIHPVRYAQPEALDSCTVDEERDKREFEWFALARRQRIPILGICRGMQLINVALGGTLHPHLPDAFPDALAHRQDDGHDALHPVIVQRGSLLEPPTGAGEAEVTSSHHQSVDRLAANLTCSARSKDGVIEAIEADERADLVFCLGVQWHPERLPPESAFSMRLAAIFLSFAQGHSV